MRLAQAAGGGIALAVAVYFFPFSNVIQVCVFGNNFVSVSLPAGGIAHLSSCDGELGRLVTVDVIAVRLWIFLAAGALGGWLVFTGLQSRSLVGLKTQA